MSKIRATTVETMQRMAEEGNADIQSQLGVLYRDGLGVPKDLVHAYKWLHLAAIRDWGHLPPLREIQMVMTPSQIAEGRRLSREFMEKKGETWAEPEVVEALIVDDDPEICNLFVFMLRREGWNATTALGGQEALELLHSRQWDLLITDVVMPGMDGFTLIDTVKKVCPGLPTIIMTGNSHHNTIDVLLSGCSGYVTKPIDWPFFITLVKKILGITGTRERATPPALPVTDSGPTDEVSVVIGDAEKGVAESQCQLGIMYYTGKGLPHDLTKACVWFTRAAAQGHAASQCLLGVMHITGWGVQKDLVIAYKWLTQAKETDTDAAGLLENLKRKLKPEQRARGDRLCREFKPMIESGCISGSC